MPTYEYECQKCGHHFERFQGINEEPVKRCPECKGKVSRLLGTVSGIIFKGSGFYATDYRSPTYQAAAKADKATKSDTAAKSDTTATKADTGKKADKTPRKGS